MTEFWIFLRQELIYHRKNPARFLQTILFFLICCAVFFILLQNQQNQAQNPFLITIIICFSLLFSILFVSSDFLGEDFRDGTLEQMLLFCENIEIYIASKILASWLILCLPILIVIPFLMALIGLESQFINNCFWIFLFASIAINFICAFCGTLSIAGNQAPLMAILALPLIIPILLIAFTGFDNFIFSIKLLIAISVFCGILFTMAISQIIKIIT